MGNKSHFKLKDMSNKGQIVWVHGYPCSGKTFMGDYLSTLGWHNVDGDWKSLSKDREVLESWGKMFQLLTKWTAGAPTDEDEDKVWKAHYTELCNRAIDVANQGKNVCISFVGYKKVVREFMKSLIPDLKIIQIKVDVDLLLEKNFVRLTYALAPMTLTEMWASPD